MQRESEEKRRETWGETTQELLISEDDTLKSEGSWRDSLSVVVGTASDGKREKERGVGSDVHSFMEMNTVSLLYTVYIAS